MPGKPKLSRIAANGIRELRRDHGVEPTLDEIIWLHELGKRVENPTDGERLDLIGAPFFAGNVRLWRWTVSASVWFYELALPWFGDSDRLCFWAMAFALAHGRGQPIPDLARRGWLERLARRTLAIHESRTLADLTDRDE